MRKEDQIHGEEGNEASGGERTVVYTDIKLHCKVKHI